MAKTLTNGMNRVNALLLKSTFGEFTTIIGAAMGGLGILDIITPIAALIGALLAIAAGWYTVRIKRLQYKQLMRKESEYRAETA